MTSETVTAAEFVHGGRRRGRPPIGPKAMTPNERVRRSRALARERQAKLDSLTPSLGPDNGPIVVKIDAGVLQTLERMSALLEAQNVSLAILRQQRRDEGEWPRVLAKRLMLLERELRDGKQDIGRMPRHISRHRPLG